MKKEIFNRHEDDDEGKLFDSDEDNDKEWFPKYEDDDEGNFPIVTKMKKKEILQMHENDNEGKLSDSDEDNELFPRYEDGDEESLFISMGLTRNQTITKK